MLYHLKLASISFVTMLQYLQLVLANIYWLARLSTS